MTCATISVNNKTVNLEVNSDACLSLDVNHIQNVLSLSSTGIQGIQGSQGIQGIQGESGSSFDQLQINDMQPTTTNVYSSQKIEDRIDDHVGNEDFNYSNYFNDLLL